MKKEISILPPEGYEIDKENSTFEKIVFKQINKKPQWEDIGVIEGFYIDEYSGLCHLKSIASDTTKNTMSKRIRSLPFN